MGKLRQLVVAVGMPTIFIAYWVLALAQLWAFKSGIAVWPGWPLFGAIVVFVILSCLPLGQIAIVVFAYIGATAGWGWAWWQAILLVAPFAIVSLLLTAAGGLGSMARRRRSTY